jgi:hypothetical protein
MFLLMNGLMSGKLENWIETAIDENSFSFDVGRLTRYIATQADTGV